MNGSGDAGGNPNGLNNGENVNSGSFVGSMPDDEPMQETIISSSADDEPQQNNAARYFGKRSRSDNVRTASQSSFSQRIQQSDAPEFFKQAALNNAQNQEVIQRKNKPGKFKKIVAFGIAGAIIVAAVMFFITTVSTREPVVDTRSAFNKFANFAISGENKEDAIIGEFSDSAFYAAISKMAYSSGEKDGKQFFDELKQNGDAFIDSLEGNEGFSDDIKVKAAEISEILNFFEKYYAWERPGIEVLVSIENNEEEQAVSFVSSFADDFSELKSDYGTRFASVLREELAIEARMSVRYKYFSCFVESSEDMTEYCENLDKIVTDEDRNMLEASNEYSEILNKILEEDTKLLVLKIYETNDLLGKSDE